MDACKVRYASTYIRPWLEIEREVRTSHSDDDAEDGGDDDDDEDYDVYYAIKWIRNLITAPQIAHRNSRRKILICTPFLYFHIFFFVLSGLSLSLTLTPSHSLSLIYFLSISLPCARFLILFSSCRSSVCTHNSDPTHILFFSSDFPAHSTFHLMSFLSAPSLPRMTKFVLCEKKNIYTFSRRSRSCLRSRLVQPSTTCCNACKYSNYGRNIHVRNPSKYGEYIRWRSENISRWLWHQEKGSFV